MRNRLTYLVVGANGYIGTVLVNLLLNAGHKVIAYDTAVNNLKFSNVDCFCGDIRNTELLKTAAIKSDIIVWLAAIVSPKTCSELDEHYVYEVNVIALKKLVDVSPKKPIIFFSTNIGYGAKSKLLVYDEESPLEPISLYGKTKLDAENFLMQQGNFVILRPASAYGISPAMKSHLLLNFFIKSALSLGRVDLIEPEVNRNFIHVEDLASAVIYVVDSLDQTINNVYNVGDSRLNLTKLEIVKNIHNIFPNFEINILDGEVDEDRRDYIVSNEKIEKLGFKCSKDFKEGVLEVISFYMSQSR